MKPRIAISGGRCSTTLLLTWLLILFLNLHQLVNAFANYHQQPQQNGFLVNSAPGPAPLPPLPPPPLQVMDTSQSQQQPAQQQQPPLQQQSTQQQQQQPPDLSSNNNQEANGHQQQPRDSDRDNQVIFRFHGIALNATTVRLVWSLRSGYPAEYFDINYGPIPSDTHVFSVQRLNGTTRDYTFHDLKPETMYQFELRAYSNQRSFAQLTVVQTPPASYAPPKQIYPNDIMPKGLNAEAKSHSTIQLSWTEPEKPARIGNSHRVNVIRYYIASKLSSSSSSSSNVAANESSLLIAGAGAPQTPTAAQYHYLNVTDAPQSRLIVQKLKPATEYAFAVKTAYYTPDMKKVYTQSGYSMDTFAKTFEIEPSAPRNFSIQALPPTKEEAETGQPGKLELSWLPPESPNGQLKGYVILYAHDLHTPDELWNRIEVNGANINHWYVSKSKPGGNFYFKMRAINGRGASVDSDTRHYVAPAASPADKMINMPIPANNLVMLIIICMFAILFILFLLVSRLACRTRRKPRKGSMQSAATNQNQKLLANGGSSQANMPKLNGFASTNSSSTVAARVGTLARRRDNSSNKPDFWISAMDQQSSDVKSNISEKSNSDLNMAMVSIQRDSPQFATTQLAPALPEYRFATSQDHHLMQQLQHQPQGGHYHPGHQFGTIAYDQMDNATASALMTLSKRQQQQMQKYQIQFATTGAQPPTSMAGNAQAQGPSPHQQPPPPPPLNIEQQQQSMYGTNQSMGANTRSLRMHRPTLYDPVSGSFVQSAEAGPPNYSAHPTNTHHTMHPILGQSGFHQQTANSNTLQFHPHQTSTLLSRRSTNTLRSFQAGSTYGQLPGAQANGISQFGMPPPPPNSIGSAVNQQPQQLLQSHQAVINQLNNSTYPSLPLKHVSTVRPQIMSSLEDHIELELAEKEQQQQQPNLEEQKQTN